MNVHMYVIRKLEYAVDQCSGECDIAECNDDAVHSWDEAVAYYTGSIPKTTGKDGTLLYTLAQRRCLNFGTCMREGDDAGMAYANSEIFTQFRTGKMNLMLGNCKDLRMQVDIISQNMAVPLIQGVFRYAHIMDKQLTKTEKAQGEGAAFAASVLPLVYDCSTADAAIIYDNMRVGNQGMADFVLVKQTFERNYDCLGITCEDMGGLIDDVYGGYWEDADPCGQNNSTQLWSPSISFSVDYSTTSAPTAVSTNESSGIIILNNEPDNTISSGSPFVYFPLLNSMALVFTGLLIATL